MIWKFSTLGKKTTSVIFPVLVKLSFSWFYLDISNPCKDYPDGSVSQIIFLHKTWFVPEIVTAIEYGWINGLAFIITVMIKLPIIFRASTFEQRHLLSQIFYVRR